MKLEKVLDNLNSFEKNSFLKILDSILSENPKNVNEVDKILSETSKDLKNIDNINIAKVDLPNFSVDPVKLHYENNHLY